MPSIGALPQLYVAGGCVAWRLVLALTKPTARSMLRISGSLMSSFISAAKIMLSPSACHSVIALRISCKKSFFGRSVLSVRAKYQTCCWCVDMGPDETHGLYAAMIRRM